MKKQGSLFTGIILPTLFFLLVACTAMPTGIQQGDGMHTPAITTTKGTTTSTRMPVNNMTLPPQATALPKPTAMPVIPTSTRSAMPTQQTPTPAPPGNAGYTDLSAAAQAVLALINQERAGMNLPALQMSNALINSAHLHNVAMFQANTLSHQLPGEAALGTRITAQGVKWSMVAENIGYGYGDATQTAISLNQSMFAEKPPDDGHRQNILSNANIIGIDIIVNTQNAQVWLTEDFARPA